MLLLQACVPIYVPIHIKLKLEQPGAPVVAPNLIAAGDREPISILRSVSSPEGRQIYRGTHPEGGVVGGGATGGGFVLIAIENRTFEPAISPETWVCDALQAGLENAGYRVESADSPAAARTPLVVSVAVTNFSAEETGGVFDLHNLTCTGKVAAEIKLTKRGEVAFDRVYQGDYQEKTTCAHEPALSFVMRKALESLLDRAIPELAAQLAQPIPTVANASRHPGAGP